MIKYITINYNGSNEMAEANYNPPYDKSLRVNKITRSPRTDIKGYVDLELDNLFNQSTESIDLDRWGVYTDGDFTNIESMLVPCANGSAANAFSNCDSFYGNLPYPDFDVDNMDYYAYECTQVTGNFDSLNAKSAAYAFYDCYSMSGYPSVGDRLENAAYMYTFCQGLEGAPVVGSNLNNAAYMYASCSKLEGAPAFTNTITNAYGMYMGCYNVQGDLVFDSDENYSVLENVEKMFYSRSPLRPINIYVPEGGRLNGLFRSSDVSGIWHDDLEYGRYYTDSGVTVIFNKEKIPLTTGVDKVYIDPIKYKNICVVNEVPTGAGTGTTRYINVIKKDLSEISPSILSYNISSDPGNCYFVVPDQYWPEEYHSGDAFSIKPTGMNRLYYGSSTPCLSKYNVYDSANSFEYVDAYSHITDLSLAFTSAKVDRAFTQFYPTAPVTLMSSTYYASTSPSLDVVVYPTAVRTNDTYRSSNAVGHPVSSSESTAENFMYYGCRNLQGDPTISPVCINSDSMFKACYNISGRPVLTDTLERTNEMFASCSNITNVPAFPPQTILNANNMFRGCTNMGTSETDSLPVMNVYNAQNMFRGTNISYSSGGSLPVSTNTDNTFADCIYMKDPIPSPESTNMSHMYCNCYNLKGELDTVVPYSSSSTDDSYAFYNCYNLKCVPWSPSSAVNEAYKYFNCSNLRNRSTGTTYFYVSSLSKNCSHMYYGCYQMHGTIFSLPPSVQDCTSMFSGCSFLTGIAYLPNGGAPCSNMYNFTKVTSVKSVSSVSLDPGYDASNAFSYCYLLGGSPVIPVNAGNTCNMYRNCNNISGTWGSAEQDMDYLIDGSNMFYNCYNLGNVSGSTGHYSLCLNLPNIENASHMFYECQNMGSDIRIVYKRINIGDKCTDMSNMFYNCVNLGGPAFMPNTLLPVNIHGMYAYTLINGNLDLHLCDTISDMDNLFYYRGLSGSVSSANQLNVYVKPSGIALGKLLDHSDDIFGFTVTWTKKSTVEWYNSRVRVNIFTTSTSDRIV